MAVNIIIFVIALLIVAIWVIYGLKRIRHKFLAIFLIVLVLFSFLSFGFVFGQKKIPMDNISDLGNVVKLYFSWLGGVFGNFRTITADAVKMNWHENNSNKST
jgi:glucan phosphoethanolaminetransferase (alkaline phosphatase superfamily)